MVEDVKFFKREGADGIVLGCLNRDNEVNVEHCRKLLSAWDSKNPATFHRAFDETKKEDLKKNLDTLIDLGFTRVLSSGFEASAEAGIVNLKAMIDHTATKNLIVMPGAGVTAGNVLKIIAGTGCTEVHTSARSSFKDSIPSRLSMGGGSEDLQPLMICDQSKVKEIIRLIKS